MTNVEWLISDAEDAAKPIKAALMEMRGKSWEELQRFEIAVHPNYMRRLEGLRFKDKVALPLKSCYGVPFVDDFDVGTFEIREKRECPL